MKARPFDIGEDLPLPLARLVWAWEEKRSPRDCAPRSEFPLLRLPGGGAQMAFVLAPIGDGDYETRLVGALCPAELVGATLADAAFEAWLTRSPMTLDGGDWRAVLVPLVDGDTHIVLGLVAAAQSPAREAA
jgi:hypothetical protein